MSKRPSNSGACRVTFMPSGAVVTVPIGTKISVAAAQAQLRLNLPCGGQGRCGRCLVRVLNGTPGGVRSAKLAPELARQGYVLGCQATVNSDLTVLIPEQEEMEKTLLPQGVASEKLASARRFEVDPATEVKRCYLELAPPNLEDNTADLDRLYRHLNLDCGYAEVSTSLEVVRDLGQTLRNSDWQVTATLEKLGEEESYRLLSVVSGRTARSTYGVAIDIGTTSNVVHLVDLDTGKVVDAASTYNAQISRGEDVISRIIYSQREHGLADLQDLVIGTLNGLIEELAARNDVPSTEMVRATVAGNTTMLQLFLGIDPQPIRLEPYIPAMTHAVPVKARDLGLNICPEAKVDCLPSVGAYVGADITAGVLASGMADESILSLFIDIGTNGEMVLGNSDFLICCACSAGPAFEGSGVEHGMRAATGAIDSIWIGRDYEPTIRVIGDAAPKGVCGSGMISLLSEMFLSGVIQRGGRISKRLDTPRIRTGSHGAEYVLVWAEDSATGEDIYITEVDIENLIRTKAAIYAGMMVLLDSVGIPREEIERVLIGGAFGQYLNVEAAINIGLLPDMPWDRFQFLGNTSVAGAYQCLANSERRRRVDEIGAMMTYLELSADNRFMDAFTAAMFLPHTDSTLFPSVRLRTEEGESEVGGEE